MTIERRSAELEIRTSGRRLEGYAAIFGARARIADFEEEIRSGAFAASLVDGDKLALVDHDATKVLGRTRNNSLRLSEDSRGLHFAIDLPKTSLANDIIALAESDSLGGASFGFIAKRDAWSGTLRTLHEIDLREISIVSAWPAYPETTVSARSLQAEHRSIYQRRMSLIELGALR